MRRLKVADPPRGNRLDLQTGYMGGWLRAWVDLDRGLMWRESMDEPLRRFRIPAADLERLWQWARAAHGLGDLKVREQFPLGTDAFDLVLDGVRVEIRADNVGTWTTVAQMQEIWAYVRREDLAGEAVGEE